MSEDPNDGLAKDDPALTEALAGAAQAPAETQEPVLTETVGDDPALVAALSGATQEPELEVGGAGLVDPLADVADLIPDLLNVDMCHDVVLSNGMTQTFSWKGLQDPQNDG